MSLVISRIDDEQLRTIVRGDDYVSVIVVNAIVKNAKIVTTNK